MRACVKQTERPDSIYITYRYLFCMFALREENPFRDVRVLPAVARCDQRAAFLRSMSSRKAVAKCRYERTPTFVCSVRL